MLCTAYVDLLSSYPAIEYQLTGQHHVLLFRDLKLTPKQQYEMTLVSSPSWPE